MHLSEDPGQVADLGQSHDADGGVDGVGAQEGEIGEVALVQFDPHLGGVGPLPSLGYPLVGAIDAYDPSTAAGQTVAVIANPVTRHTATTAALI